MTEFYKPHRGAIARCGKGYLGRIECDEPETVTCPDGTTFEAWVGVHLLKEVDANPGDPWSSRCPTVVVPALDLKPFDGPEPAESRPDWPRKDLLEAAIKITCGDRNAHYGEPLQDFNRTAALLNALYGPTHLREGVKFKPADVAKIAMMIKFSRSMWKEKRDNWEDIAGYAGCGYECTVAEEMDPGEGK